MARTKMTELSAHALGVEARILAALAEQPMCNNALAGLLGLSRSGAMKYTERMRQASPKRLHVCGHRQPTTGGYPRPLFAPGDGPDEVYEPKVQKVPKKDFDRKAARLEKIVAAIPGTAKEIAAASHVVVCTLHDYLDLLRAENQPGVFIKKWVQRGARNAWAPVYAIGRHKDAPRPPEQSRAERYRMERAKPENVKRHQDRQRTSRLRARLKQKPNTIFGALGL